jgi:hypothetical protein
LHGFKITAVVGTVVAVVVVTCKHNYDYGKFMQLIIKQKKIMNSIIYLASIRLAT